MLYEELMSNTCMGTMETESKNLSDLNETLLDMRKQVRDAHDEYRARKVDMCNFNVSFKDLHDKTAIGKEYYKLANKLDACRDAYDILSVARRGIEGAVRYYVAVELNHALSVVLPKFTGKKAGPKTTDKFWKAVSEEMPVEGLTIYMGSHHTVYVRGQYDGATRGVDAELWWREPLTDIENKFVESFQVDIPVDEFDGQYPVDWIDWATRVRVVNEYLKSAYDKFVAEQDAMVHALKIGDTEFYRVHSYDQKLEG